MGRVLRTTLRSDLPCSCIFDDVTGEAPVAGPSTESVQQSHEVQRPVPQAAEAAIDEVMPQQEETSLQRLVSSGHAEHHASVTARLRRRLLPDSSIAPGNGTDITGSASEPPWRASGSFESPSSDAHALAITGSGVLSFGSILSIASTSSLATNSSIRVSRLAGSSPAPAIPSFSPDLPLDNGGSDSGVDMPLPTHTSMLPPRLGTPVPDLPSLSSNSNALHITAAGDTAGIDVEAGAAPGPRLTSTNSANPASFDDTLTSIGRRALSRHRSNNTSMRNNSSSDEAPLRLPGIRSIDMDTLERAQQAIEGSRQALEQAMQALRSVLRNSESRLERIANLIRQQMQSDTAVPLAPLPQSLELEIEGDRSEYNLERSLANLRAASIEIDRVLSSSNIPRSATATAAARLSSAVAELPPLLAARRSNGTLDSLFGLSSTASSVGSATLDSSIRQPVPRRPLRYLRPLAHAGLGSTPTGRARASLSEHAARPSRSQRPASQGSILTHRNLESYGTSSLAENSTASLARTVYTALATEPPSTSDEDVPSSPHDMWDVVEHSDSTPVTRSRGIGRWTRLDANGDEVTDITGNMRESTTLGWTWSLRPLSPPFMLEQEGEKSSSGDAIHYLGRRDSERSSQASLSGRSVYNGEVVGR